MQYITPGLIIAGILLAFYFLPWAALIPFMIGAFLWAKTNNPDNLKA